MKSPKNIATLTAALLLATMLSACTPPVENCVPGTEDTSQIMSPVPANCT